MKKLTYEIAEKELTFLLQELQEENIKLGDLEAKVAKARELLDWCEQELRKVAEVLSPPGQ